MSQKIVFTVTNDLNFDQRMIRICTSLQQAGYEVTIIGFLKKSSPPLVERPYQQIRLPIIKEQGKLMYVDFWKKLFFRLLKTPADIICCVDLDTMLPVYYASGIKKCKRVYDAHELFTELKEVITRPPVHKMWSYIENKFIRSFKSYTVGRGCAQYFKDKYDLDFEIIRSATVLRPFTVPPKPEKYILYQGAVNVGRCFEQLIPAMQWVNAPLIICGNGNFFKETQALLKQYNLEGKIEMKGYVDPVLLRDYTTRAWIGITLFESESISNRMSLANRYFDYMHHGVPQLCINHYEYKEINKEYELACLIDKVSPENIAENLNRMLEDSDYHTLLSENAMKARATYCWQEEEKKLLDFYGSV